MLGADLGKRISMGVTHWWRHRLRRPGGAVVACLAVILVLAACTSAGPGRKAGADSDTRVISLTEIATLKTLFNHDDGHPRLVLLLSPT
jgi:hypothetical protein